MFNFFFINTKITTLPLKIKKKKKIKLIIYFLDL